MDIKLYRVVCQAELYDLRQSGQFRAGPNGFRTAKWFAERLGDAVSWGEWFTGISGTPHDRYVMIEVPEATADEFVPIGRRDGVGPARCATLEQLRGMAWIEVFP